MPDTPKKDPRANLIPFKPGQSGNPGGKPKALTELRQLAMNYYPEAMELAINLVRGRYTTTEEVTETIGRGKGAKTTTRLVKKSMPVPPDIALKAAEFIAERALGKAVQPVSGPDPDEPLRIQRIERVILQIGDRDGSTVERVIEGEARDITPRRRDN